MRQDTGTRTEADAGAWEQAHNAPLGARQAALDAGAEATDVAPPTSGEQAFWEGRETLWTAVGQLWRAGERHYGAHDWMNEGAPLYLQQEQEPVCPA